MNDFIFHNPDKIYFGKNQIGHLADELLKYGKKVLLVYGGGSIKKNGLYDKIMEIMDLNGLECFELSGVEPNPRHTTVNKGVKICREKNIDVVLAVGGGSTMDCAKGVAATTLADTDDVWDLVCEGQWITKALPIVAVLTNAAAGSEMDVWAVISNMDTNEKRDIGGEGILPRAAFENPEYSFTLSAYQTACGSFDIFSHVLDNYYLAGDATFDLTLRLQEAVMSNVVKYAPIAMREPENYEARANLMWASSMALNDILNAGSMHICACHIMEHELSAYYDITHGHGLAILTPRWLTYILNEQTAPAIYRLGVSVFQVENGLSPMEGAKATINSVSDFCFKTLGLQSTLSELNIDEKYFEVMAEHAYGGGIMPGPRDLSKEDIVNIYKMCL